MPYDYKIMQGGLGWTLWWWDGADWVWVMDSVSKADCLDEMWSEHRRSTWKRRTA